MKATGEITRLLESWRDGNKDALDELFDLVYRDLRRIAHRRLAAHASTPTLNTTALVHEAYLKLFHGAGAENRHHFFALAAKAMRQILVDYSRRKIAQKRGLGAKLLQLDEARQGQDVQLDNLVALDLALNRLALRNERLCQVVDLRYFGGLSVEETAEVLKTSGRTVKRDWRVARAFLYRELSGAPEP